MGGGNKTRLFSRLVKTLSSLRILTHWEKGKMKSECLNIFRKCKTFTYKTLFIQQYFFFVLNNLCLKEKCFLNFLVAQRFSCLINFSELSYNLSSDLIKLIQRCYWKLANLKSLWISHPLIGVSVLMLWYL